MDFYSFVWGYYGGVLLFGLLFLYMFWCVCWECVYIVVYSYCIGVFYFGVMVLVLLKDVFLVVLDNVIFCLVVCGSYDWFEFFVGVNGYLE